MRMARALSLLVVTWSVVAARAGPTGTGEPGETLPCTCVPTCTVYMYSYMHVRVYIPPSLVPRPICGQLHSLQRMPVS